MSGKGEKRGLGLGIAIGVGMGAGLGLVNTLFDNLLARSLRNNFGR